MDSKNADTLAKNTSAMNITDLTNTVPISNESEKTEVECTSTGKTEKPKSSLTHNKPKLSVSTSALNTVTHTSPTPNTTDPPLRRAKSSTSLQTLENIAKVSHLVVSGNVEQLAEQVTQSIQSLPKPPPKVVSIWKDFRDFAFQGSVVDLSVGIIVGGAFGKIVNSLVNDVIMPPIGMLLRGVDFANIFVLLKRGKKTAITKAKYKSLAQAKEDGAVTVNFGVFLNSLINFLVISMIIFTFIRTINKLKRKKQTKTVKECRYCFSKVDIRAVKCPYCSSSLELQKTDPESDSESLGALTPSTEPQTPMTATPDNSKRKDTTISFTDVDSDDDDDYEDHKSGGKQQYKYWKKNLKKQISRTVLE